MKTTQTSMIDANEAVASVAYRAKELGKQAQNFVDERFELYERLAKPYKSGIEE